MDHVELRTVRRAVLQRIRLVKLEWIIRLRIDVYPDYLKPSAVVTRASTASTAE